MTWSRQHSRPDGPPPRLSKGGNDPVDVTGADGTILKTTAPGPAADIQARVDRAITNPAPGDLRREIARLQVMIDLAWEDDVAGTPSAGEDVLGAYHAMDRALAAGDGESARQQWAVLGQRLEHGMDQARRHDRVLHLIECQRKLTDTHVKNARLTNRSFTLVEVSDLVAALGKAVKRRVPDRAVLRQIYDDFDAEAIRMQLPFESAIESPTAESPVAAASPGETTALTSTVRGTNDDDITSEE